ncbi:hypothetical protein [Actinoplanes sp. CA-252034]|uniref:hypothetical protein n=1 Tax=Actinoplanes sp. CA-252034 TaxID=3239906 RepID=UPI003D99370D
MSAALTYDGALARVRLSAPVPAAAAYATVDRTTNGVQWTVVRGAGRLTPAGATVTVDDYEFPPGQATTYRVRAYNSGGVLLATDTAAITAAIDRVWFKNVTRPFLNRPVTVVNRPEIGRKSRAGVFPVLGRSLPIVVSELRGPSQWTLQLRTSSAAESRLVELLLASGDVLYLQVPPAYDDVPGGYVHVGDVVWRRLSPLPQDRRYVWTLPMTAVAAPGPDVVGATVTWETLLASFGSWAAIGAAFGSWAEVLEYVSDPEVVIVP